MKKHLLLLTACCCMSIFSRSQVYLSDMLNNGSTASDWNNPEIVVTSTGTGIGYVAINGGICYHFGPASATLTVNGVYNTYNFNGLGTPATPGIDWFQGLNGVRNTTQEIAGNTAPIFGILNIDNGTSNSFNITNTAGVNVGSKVNFTNGITTTVRNNHSNAALRFLDNAAYTYSNLGDAQHVNGYVSKQGNDAFTFPTGSGTDLRTLAISAPSNTTDEYAVAWVAGDPNITPDKSNAGALHSTSAVQSPIAAVNEIGQWDWVAVNNTGAGLNITVSIPNVTAFGAIDNLRLVGWNGSQWINLSTNGSGPFASGVTEGATLTGIMQAGVQAVAIGKISPVILPVTFISFNATKQNTTALLSWKVAQEQNILSYVVERSADSRNFSTVGTVASLGNTSNTRTYNLTDAQPLKGVNYYRIKIIDKDNKVTYSEMRLLNFDSNSYITLFPNPTKDRFTITGVEVGMKIIVVNINGQTIVSQNVTSNAASILLTEVATGLYQVQVYGADGKLLNNKSIVKE